MENEEMSKADLIAMLVSIREVARTNGEIHTVEHIDKILEEIRKQNRIRDHTGGGYLNIPANRPKCLIRL